MLWGVCVSNGVIWGANANTLIHSGTTALTHRDVIYELLAVLVLLLIQFVLLISELLVMMWYDIVDITRLLCDYIVALLLLL